MDVQPGQWITITVPDVWPVVIRMGQLDIPAFIDHTADGTTASIRCPNLPKGIYRVAAQWDGGGETADIRITG